MRTLEEITLDITASVKSSDIPRLKTLADELNDLGTRHARASAENLMGYVHFNSGNHQAAMDSYLHALDEFKELDDHSGVARVTENIGRALSGVGNHHEALGYYQQATRLHGNLNDLSGVARNECYEGVVHTSTGDYPAALRQFRSSLQNYEDLGEMTGVALVTGNMGHAYYYIGDYPAALEQFQHSLRLYRELGDRLGVARMMGNMANVYDATGEHNLALENYRRALEVYNEIGNRRGAALIKGNIGFVHYNNRDYQLAMEHYRQALQVYQELGNRAGESLITGNMIGTLLELRQDDEAADLLVRQESLPMYSPLIRAEHMANKAKLAEHRQDLAAAKELLNEAKSIVEESGDQEVLARYHLRLRNLAQALNDFSEYIRHNDEFNRINEQILGHQTTQRLTMIEADRRMQAERSEREKERALLYGALPQSVADRMIRGEQITGDHYKLASVIFLDIVGFTRISDRIPPGHVVHLLEQIFSTLDAVCKKHGVMKIKTIGDCYMGVAFDSVGTAAACSPDMRHALDELDVTMPAELGDTSWTSTVGEINVRIGIHCGPVTAGVIGTQRLQYDVWGDTVNVASRMESTGEGGRIHVSDTFAQLLAGTDTETIQHSLIPRGQVEVKGKGTMTTYWLEES